MPLAEAASAQPGGTTTVESIDSTMSGPGRDSPGASRSRRTIAVSTNPVSGK